MAADLQHHRINVGQVSLHVVTAGPEDGKPLLMLHGFPECWYGWFHQIEPMVEAGFRVIVPDQRGYGESDKPARVADYAVPALTADMLGLLDHFGIEKTDLVGHDWGGAIAWSLALNHPERIRSYAVLNMPHPLVFQRTLRTSAQLKRSWYIGLFQLPALPEAYLSRNNYAALRGALYKHSTRRAYTEADLATYDHAWSQPGAVRAMVNWYRAAARHPAPAPESWTLAMPSMLIWGKHDSALGFEMVKPTLDFMPDAQLHVLDGAAHFVQHDEPEKVSELLREFLLNA